MGQTHYSSLRLPAVAAIAGLLFWDAARIWMPSVLFVVGDAGDTPATILGAYALGTAVIPFLAAMALRGATVSVGWTVGVAGLIIGRLVLVVADGGMAQVIGSSLSVVAAGLTVAALATRADRMPTVRVAFLTGIAASWALYAAMGGIDALWQQTALATLWSLALAVGTLALFRSIGPTLGPRDIDNTAPVSSPPSQQAENSAVEAHSAWPWVVLGLVVAVLGILAMPTGRIAIATGWSDRATAATAVAMAGWLILSALAARSLHPRTNGFLAAALTMLGAIGALRPTSLITVGAQFALVAGIGLLAGSPIQRSAHPTGRSTDDGKRGQRAAQRRKARHGAAFTATFAIVGFAYYAPYDLSLPYPSRGVLLAAAGVLALVGLATARPAASAQAARVSARVTVRTASLALVTLLGLTSITAVLAASPDQPTQEWTERDDLRVVLYNIHMGFDTRGRLSIEQLTATMAATQADVLVLNEVDRGWMTTGGRDNLRILQRTIAMTSAFAPAADDVWGNAIMSRPPIRDFRYERLPRGRDAMARSVFTATLEIGVDRHIAVIGTHLSHVDQLGDTRLPQARTIAAEVARMRDRGVPVIVAGDLNAEPGAQELMTFGDLVRAAVPPGHPTWPSSDPEVQIDHILVSPDFRVTGWEYLISEDSDHLGVVVDLMLAPRTP
ncbi:MAG: endonuclease/exonuclease/phosphatase family protein [Nitriliruptoraceae bacterium]